MCIRDRAQKEQQTNPYNLPAGTAAPQTDATAPAESAPAPEIPANQMKALLRAWPFKDKLDYSVENRNKNCSRGNRHAVSQPRFPK